MLNEIKDHMALNYTWHDGEASSDHLLRSDVMVGLVLGGSNLVMIVWTPL
jgi:hypothetical protein